MTRAVLSAAVLYAACAAAAWGAVSCVQPASLTGDVYQCPQQLLEQLNATLKKVRECQDQQQARNLQ